MAITTIYTYPLDSTQREFNVPFEYLARRFVVLTLIGTDRKELTLTTDYRFTTKSTVQTNVAWGPGAGYERIEIRRNTSATDRLVDFADGSILRASELNISQIQTLHVAEEARNMVADTISENSDGALDARGRRVVNVADPVDPGDAVTLRFEQAWAESTLNSKNTALAAASTATTQASNALAHKNAAETARTAAETARTQAGTYATNSQASASASDTARAAAVTAKDASATSAAAALASQNAAKTSETNAKTSETNAATSAANLGNAISLYAKVESVVGDAVAWSPTVTHRIGRLTHSGSAITNADSVLTLNTQFTAIQHPTQPYMLFRSGTKNIGAMSANEASGIIAMATYTSAGSAAYTFTWDRNGKFTAGSLEAPTVQAGTAMTALGRAVTIGATSAYVAVVAAGTSPAGKIRFVHNLGVQPIGYHIEFRCIVADAGYAVGDIITPLNMDFSSSTTYTRGGHTRFVDNNTVDYFHGGTGVVLIHKTTGTATTMDLASWQVRCTAIGLAQ